MVSRADFDVGKTLVRRHNMIHSKKMNVLSAPNLVYSFTDRMKSRRGVSTARSILNLLGNARLTGELRCRGHPAMKAQLREVDG